MVEEVAVNLPQVLPQVEVVGKLMVSLFEVMSCLEVANNSHLLLPCFCSGGGGGSQPAPGPAPGGGGG